ncbi:uncharacterized protein LOC143289709 isoform X2 [Babylonia areolata]|uniref:uncharacterized protein LOC143289709 isoform X2 n=1 Tax=Babylonia areolata TaxID=304850 RepID=UPI003FD500F0
MATSSLLSGLCPLIFILGVGVWKTSAAATQRQRRTVSNFPFSKLEGEWYDIGRTTLTEGRATWTSQQWNFVQGRDSTLVALVNGMCKACGGCSDTVVYKVTETEHPDGGFLLQGNGETLLLRVESDLQSEIVVSLCFTNGTHNLPHCPRSKLQVSVLSRKPVMKDVDRWANIILHLPVSMDQMDTSTGEGCPRPFINPKLVTEDLVSDLDTKVRSQVGFRSRRSSMVLPCSLGPRAHLLQHNTQVVWRRGQTQGVLTRNSTVLKRARGARLLRGEGGDFHLLLRGVGQPMADVYSCYLEYTDSSSTHVLLSRVVVSSAGYVSGPVIVYHSGNVTAREGDTVVLQCYANANPPPLLTWWLRTPGAQEAYVRKGKGGNKLRIRNVQDKDEGVYKCEASSRQAPAVSVFFHLQVGFPPQAEIQERSVMVLYGRGVEVTCHVHIKSPDVLLWRKDGQDITPDHRRSVTLIKRSQYRFELRLLVREMRKEDFGHYTCLARDHLGESQASVDMFEQRYLKGDCEVNNIPVMENFNVQRFLGNMELLEATGTGWGNQTYVSKVQGLFITISGSLMHYYRGYSVEQQQCVDPGAVSLVSLDTPGDYLISFEGIRVRHKIVYTDYTHAVTYTCMGGSDQLPCPKNLERIQILSRHSHIPDEVRHHLYGYVQRMCVPVTSLMDTVPGICQMPADFMYKKGWIGKYPGPSCQVAKLPTQGEMTEGHVTGKWWLIGEVRPDDYTAPPRSSLHILSSGDHLIRLHRSLQSGLCTSTEADILHKSATAGSYYFDYKGRTVDLKVLLADQRSMVLYTCLAVKHDGTCYSGSQLVELYRLGNGVPGDDERTMLWMIRAVALGCVDVTRLVRVTSALSEGVCLVPEPVVKAAQAGLVSRGVTHIGCHQTLIPVSQGLTEDQMFGQWTVMYRNTESVSNTSTVGHFSQSYLFMQRKKGTLTVLSRHYESDWELCPPTQVLQLNQGSGPGDYVHVSHSSSVVLRVLSLTGDTAVVYWCRNTGSDGVCGADSLTVEVLARSPHTSIPSDRLQAIMQHCVDVCVRMGHMQPTAQVEKCKITKAVVDHVASGQVTAAFDIPVLSCKNQLLKGEQNLNVEKLTGRWTVLWRNKEFWAVRAPFAESSFVIPTHYGLLYLWRSFNNDLERCGPEEAGRFLTTSGPGNYYSGFDGVPVAMKVVRMSSDDSAMLALWCHLDDDSRCHPHRTTIEVLSRRSSIDNDTRDALFSAVDLDCVASPQWVPSTPDVCDVENDVLTTAYIDGLDSMEYTKIGCRVDLIGGQAGVTEDLIIGSWRSVYQTNMSQSLGAAAATEFHFTKTASGSISLLYRLYSSDTEECLPSRVMELTADPHKSGTVYQLKHCDSDVPYGYVYVLYSDGDHLGVLLCVGVGRDGLCDPRTQSLVLLHRQGAGSEVNETVVEAVRGLGADACVDHDTLVMPELNPCPVPEAILTDAARGELEACSETGERVQCYPRYVPVHPAFDVRDFAGTWYTVADWVTEGQGRNKPEEWTTYHFVPRDNGTVAMLFTEGQAESCQPTQLRVLRAMGDGRFYFTLNNTQGVMKVVWMDEDLALTFWCFDLDATESWCPSMHVTVLSRQPVSAGGWEVPSELKARVADVCVTAENFVVVDTEPCRIPDDIMSAVEEDEYPIAASFSVIQCAQQFVPAVGDFNMTQFSGMWHTVWQTSMMWGNATWQSVIRSYVVRDDGSVIMAFTGLPPDKDHCMPMDLRQLTLSNGTGQWTFFIEGNQTVRVKVVWTDYTSTALLHTCSGGVGADQQCPPSSRQVELLSRMPSDPPGAVEVMGHLLPSLCVEREEVGPVVTGKCQITKELEQLVEGAQRGGAADPVTSCRMEDIPLDNNFTLTQMRGTWFEVARTRLTFNTMESVISVFKYNPDRDVLDGLFIGTLHQQCQSPLQSVTRKKMADGPDSIIEGRIQVGDSIFPWITFNILYYDGSMLVHLACYGQNKDGTCPRDNTEVTVLGRSRQLTPMLDGRLDELMRTVCLRREDLVVTKETADCLPKLMTGKDDVDTGLPDTSTCKLSDIPVMQNVDDSQLLGRWYGLGSKDYSRQQDPAGFLVSVHRSQPHTLLWKHWDIRNGSCLGQKAVYLKAACTDMGTGDYISTKASSFMLQWTAFKILRLQGDLMLVYSCTRETSEGTCDPEGIRVDLLGRSPSATLDDIIPMLDVLPSVCLKPEFIESVVSTAECDALASQPVAMVTMSACAIDALPAVHVDLDKISGVWYEVTHTVDKMFPMTNAVLVYQALPHHGLSMHLTAIGPNGQCVGPMQGVIRQRCHGNPGPENMGRLKVPGIWSWAPWRVLHADYNSSLIVLSCMDEQPDGSCSPHGLKIHFMARHPHPHAHLRPQLYTILDRLKCFEGVVLEDVYQDGMSCKHKLDPIPSPAA